MKAKETVMPKDRIAAIMMASEGFGYEKGIDVAAEQATISFKAGIREVVEWVEHHTNKDRLELITKFICISEIDWQAKLKEWGVDNA